MDDVAVRKYIAETFERVEVSEAFGYTFFFYGDDHRLPFATLAARDNEHDRVSNLDRRDVFRLNIGVSKATFGEVVDRAAEPDYTRLDVIMPHPKYAAQWFVCVLNPTGATREKVKQLLAEAHGIAAKRNAKRGKLQSPVDLQ